MKYGLTFVNGGYRPAIAKEGPKWTQVVCLDGSTVKVRRVRGTLPFRRLQGYTLRQLAIRMLRRENVLGVKMHVTRSARKILEEAKV